MNQTPPHPVKKIESCSYYQAPPSSPLSLLPHLIGTLPSRLHHECCTQSRIRHNLIRHQANHSKCCCHPLPEPLQCHPQLLQTAATSPHITSTSLPLGAAVLRHRRHERRCTATTILHLRQRQHLPWWPCCRSLPLLHSLHPQLWLPPPSCVTYTIHP